ncbi:hypothetical protein [Chamaesiphon sp.]|uniref:hypothetical protein n=1 Tax=Chamaesiphon sp. TaxID=2814140 RepID=UPI0035932F8C
MPLDRCSNPYGIFTLFEAIDLNLHLVVYNKSTGNNRTISSGTQNLENRIVSLTYGDATPSKGSGY